MKALNKYNLKSGDKAFVDISFANGGYTVEVLQIWKLFAKVKDEKGKIWQLMIDRLTPVIPI